MENKKYEVGKSNLDVWAIQKDPEHVLTALKKFKYNEDDLVLFTNCVSKLRIGDRNITTREFDTVISSNANDVIIFLQRNGLADSSDIVRYLDKKNLNYSIVNGNNYDLYEDDIEIPELWFAREKQVLKEALDESMQKKNISNCNFYPNLDGELSVGYYLENGEFMEIEGRHIKGIVETDDKMVLMIHQQDIRNLDSNQVIETICERGFVFDVITDTIPKVFKKSSKMV